MGLRAQLKRAISFEGRVRLTTQRVGDGEAFLEQACRKGWEGLIAERAASSCTHGRSRDWRELECGNRQELVIGGYTDPKSSRIAPGARLERLRRTRCPFEKTPREKGAHWVSPRLVAEVAA